MQRTAVAAAVLAVLVAPAAAAQEVGPPDAGLSLSGWQSPLTPGSTNDVTLGIQYNCAKVPPEQTVDATIVTRNPWWATPVGPGTVELNPDHTACAGEEATASTAVSYLVGMSGSAPALSPRTVTFNVTVNYPDAPASNETNESVAAEFAPEVTPSVDPKRSKALDGRTARHNVTVANEGNAPLRVLLRSEQVPNRLDVQTPDAGVVEAARNGTRPTWTGQIEATATLPDGVNFRNYTARFNLSTVYTEDPQLTGPSGTLEMVVFVRRSAEEIEEQQSLPGPGMAAIAAALAGLAYARRRKRY